MSLTVTRAKVKEMCGIDSSDYDTPIDNLIEDLVPVVEYALDPALLVAPAAGLLATLNLGATEVVAGEFLAQLSRTPGYAEKIVIGDLSVEPFVGDVADPSELISRGWERLSPYRRSANSTPGESVSAVGGKREDDSL